MLSRRSFLNSTVGAGVALATAQQAAPRPAAAQAKRLIVDAQVHLWKAESPDWPWVPGMKPQMPEPFTIEKLVPLMDEAGVDRAVIVPPSWPGDRNDYGVEAARRYPNRFAVMGRIPLKNPQSAELLPKWKEQPGMLGVRVTFLGPAAAWLTDGTADWFWPAAEKAGLPVMFLKLGDAIDQTVSLAKYPNVSVKLSAAPNNSTEAYPFRDFTPHIRRVFDAYGPQRCYWGTDITNGFDKATYRQRITHFTEELPFLSEADKDLIMGRAILARLGLGP